MHDSHNLHFKLHVHDRIHFYRRSWLCAHRLGSVHTCI